MNNTQPIKTQLSEVALEKLRETAEKVNAFALGLVEAMRPAVEAASKAIIAFMRSMPPELLDAFTQLGEREERKERSRKKYERMYARGKPRGRKSRRRW